MPLARFYASHRAGLPSVFRSLQIGPVWRAERPQKGRFRQFVQCDIDIIGEPGPIAEVELITATAATLDALGLAGCTVRVNDRRLITSALAVLGFPAETHEAALITIDKLDKLGQDGVVAELRERDFPAGPVDAIEAFFGRATTIPSLPFGETAIRALLPDGVDETAIAELAAIGLAVEDARRSTGSTDELVRFDPWLVRGMGYYTGTIFEIEHPALGYSLGGGGRYDGMIGRFLGTDVPAAGSSLGFERLVDLVDLPQTPRGGCRGARARSRRPRGDARRHPVRPRRDRPSRSARDPSAQPRPAARPAQGIGIRRVRLRHPRQHRGGARVQGDRVMVAASTRPRAPRRV